MQAGKRKALSGIFIFIYIVFTLLLVYLLFFNTGLEVKEQLNPFTGTKDIFVVNATDRVINNVGVKYSAGGSGGDINGFAELKPKEKKRLDIDFLGIRQVTITAQAPFHQAASKLVDLNPKAGRPINIEMPSPPQLGKPFEFSVEVCNHAGNDAAVKVQELHEPLVFFSPNNETSLVLKSEECRKVEYSLVPGKAGETTIYFNVNFSNTNEQFQKAVIVHG